MVEEGGRGDGVGGIMIDGVKAWLSGVPQYGTFMQWRKFGAFGHPLLYN